MYTGYLEIDCLETPPMKNAIPETRFATRCHDWLQQQWYQTETPSSLLLPLEKLFRQAVRARRTAYAAGARKTVRLPVPVIVIGNITVGGVGKTPLVIWLARELIARGLKPGIISRGYGGRRSTLPLRVYPDSDPLEAGDEPVLIAQKTGCPVVVAKKRALAGQYLLAVADCDVVIADDGLQHYALERNVEIAVMDGFRPLGNGHLLPAGPLREPPERLSEVNRVIYSGTGPVGETVMTLQGDMAINLADPTRRRPLRDFQDQPCYALAGIGHPGRFFSHLENHGLQPETRAYPDHYAYCPNDLNRPQDWPVFMTEKDAVKCTRFADARCWSVPVDASLPPGTADSLYQLISGKKS